MRTAVVVVVAVVAVVVRIVLQLKVEAGSAKMSMVVRIKTMVKVGFIGFDRTDLELS
jgi:hypothetical protein